MQAIRLRENDALVGASKAEAALAAAEDRLAQIVASQQSTIDEARAQVGEAYREVVEAFGSQSRAAEYLDISPARLKALLAAAVAVESPEVTDAEAS
jgi:hypothetical protein